MTFTDDGTKCPYDWMPLAMANGIEWATIRWGYKDRWRNLYRHGWGSQLLWRLGALSTLFHRPSWVTDAYERKSVEGSK